MSPQKKLLSLMVLCLALACLFTNNAYSLPPEREYYELKIYHLKNKEQEQRLDAFLQQAYIPALHRAGVKKVGVFKPVAEAEAGAGSKVYVFVPYTTVEQYTKLPQALDKDKKYAADGKDYIDAPYDNPAYDRMEITFMRAFAGMPQFKVPGLKGPKDERIYELRSYEGATEKLYRNKVQMFNEGNEIGIFNRLGFNAVFYGEVLAGSKMPNLVYMTTFENKASRDEHWKTFSADAEWKKLRAMPEYQHNVSHQDMIFLKPTAYSEI